jgi:antitoxin HicB
MGVPKTRAEHYRSLNYAIEIEKDNEGDFIARIPLLPGCLADGGTAEEAVLRIEEARDEWIEARLEANLPIPEPQTEFSGKWIVRTSPDLHRKIAACARRENISLNLFLNNVLAEAVGCRQFSQGAALANWKLIFEHQTSGMIFAFGNRHTGGLMWCRGQAPAGQDESPTKQVDLAELRA